MIVDDVIWNRLRWKQSSTFPLIESCRGISLISVSWQDALNTPGSGEFSIPTNDELLSAYPTLLAWKNVVKFWMGSTCVMAYMIRNRKTTYVTSDEWSGMVIVVSGPSVLYWLKDFIVRHDGEPRPDSPSTRYYSWASKPGPWYDPADWVEPINSLVNERPALGKEREEA